MLVQGGAEETHVQGGAEETHVQGGAEETHVQGGAEETHVFHIRITLFIFNIKSFNYTKKKVF